MQWVALKTKPNKQTNNQTNKAKHTSHMTHPLKSRYAPQQTAQSKWIDPPKEFQQWSPGLASVYGTSYHCCTIRSGKKYKYVQYTFTYMWTNPRYNGRVVWKEHMSNSTCMMFLCSDSVSICWNGVMLHVCSISRQAMTGLDRLNWTTASIDLIHIRIIYKFNLHQSQEKTGWTNPALIDIILLDCAQNSCNIYSYHLGD